ncbi:tlde1 domain-containing protein [Pseudescherichia vulneris]
MGWKYEQSTGKMYQDGVLIETGYSGALTNKNNPERQHVKGLGPLPRGTYNIAGHSASKGPVTIILEQTSGETFGRDDFRIHGDHIHGPAGYASAGCIILSLSTRRAILRDGGDLEVVR